MEVFFLRRNTVLGSSHISTVSVVGTMVTAVGRASHPQARAASRMAASSPVSTTSTPKRFWAFKAPLTISRGALSPPMASMIIFMGSLSFSQMWAVTSPRTASRIWSMTARERAEISAFLLRLPLTRWSSGGMMPKLMFMGWKAATVSLLT